MHCIHYGDTLWILIGNIWPKFLLLLIAIYFKNRPTDFAFPAQQFFWFSLQYFHTLMPNLAADLQYSR